MDKINSRELEKGLNMSTLLTPGQIPLGAQS